MKGNLGFRIFFSVIFLAVFGVYSMKHFSSGWFSEDVASWGSAGGLKPEEIQSIDMSADIAAVHSRMDLLTPDFLIVYPGRFTTGKRFEKVAALAGAIKKWTERTVKVVFCDFPCMDTDAVKYKLIIRATGEVCGLDGEDMLFTSDLGYQSGFPRGAVLELFTLSNLFICPSYSESFGLTVLEAASRGNFLVLNEAVPALEELGKKFGAYFMRWDARNFGFDTKETYQPSEMGYL